MSAQQNIQARGIILVVGDALAFVVFALIGLRSHEAAPSLDVFVRTVLPLLVSWFLIAPRLGVFRQETVGSLVRLAVRTMGAWLVAGAVGLLIRGMLFDRPLIASFVAVVLVGQALILVGWRVLHAAVTRGDRRAGLAE